VIYNSLGFEIELWCCIGAVSAAKDIFGGPSPYIRSVGTASTLSYLHILQHARVYHSPASHTIGNL